MTRRDLLAASASLIAARAVRAARPKLQGRDGSELVGHPAPPLHLSAWLNSPPLEIGQGDLRGKVVLLRWWTEGCPFCEATAPALNGFEQRYKSEGLRIVGVFHPKPEPAAVEMSSVRSASEEKHFRFPVAVDDRWTALRRWWLFEDRDFTSVSFVIDRRGVIRYVQPGGEFHEGDSGGFDTHESCRHDYRDIENQIRTLLREPV